MLKFRLLLSLPQRKFCDKSSHFNVETLCSPENRDKCLKQMTLATKAATNKQLDPKVSAAVLILLVKDNNRADNEPSLLFTLRSNKLRKHVRQVSFPGNFPKFRHYVHRKSYNFMIYSRKVVSWRTVTHHILTVHYVKQKKKLDYRAIK